jgi:glycosyltransferase involved in cell wall biosynthesis
MKLEQSVSVVIPTYQRPASTRRAVDSVLAQTVSCLEVIIVEDGSATDKAFHLEHPDPRIRILRHPQNQGVASARNTGIQAARGQWIAFLDSDDLWLPHKLETLFALKGIDSEKPCFIYSAYKLNTCKKHLSRPLFPYHPNTDLMNYILLWKGSIHISTWLMPQALAKAHFFNEALAAHEDWDLLLRLKQSAVPFIFCSSILGIRDNTPSSDRSEFPHLSRNYTPNRQDSFYTMYQLNLSATAKILFKTIRIHQDQPINLNLSLLASRCYHLIAQETTLAKGFVHCLIYIAVRLIHRLQLTFTPRHKDVP